MPYARRKRATKARPRRRRIARRPKQLAQNLSKNVFWFKTTGAISVDSSTGFLNKSWAPHQVTLVSGFLNYTRSYEAYKVLTMIVKIFPASVGSESVHPSLFQRGNVCTWVDQPPLLPGTPESINEVLGLPSAKLTQPRSNIKRWVNRTRGAKPNQWGLIDHDQQGDPAITTETWLTSIKLFGDNFGKGPIDTGVPAPPYYFYEQYFKVLFRSRYSQPQT